MRKRQAKKKAKKGRGSVVLHSPGVAEALSRAILEIFPDSAGRRQLKFTVEGPPEVVVLPTNLKQER